MSELLDVYSDEGRHTGIKERDAAHRDGDWHRCFHLWVVLEGGVLLQRRGASKDSWPGFLDASAAGHLEAGESDLDGLREAEEELGVRYAQDALTDLGVHEVDEPTRAGGRNRERQHVYAVCDARSLTSFTDFDRGELDGLVLVADFAALVGGEAVPGRTWDGAAVEDCVVAPDELVPTPYLGELAAQIASVRA